MGDSRRVIAGVLAGGAILAGGLIWYITRDKPTNNVKLLTQVEDTLERVDAGFDDPVKSSRIIIPQASTIWSPNSRVDDGYIAPEEKRLLEEIREVHGGEIPQILKRTSYAKRLAKILKGEGSEYAAKRIKELCADTQFFFTSPVHYDKKKGCIVYNPTTLCHILGEELPDESIEALPWMQPENVADNLLLKLAYGLLLMDENRFADGRKGPTRDGKYYTPEEQALHEAIAKGICQLYEETKTEYTEIPSCPGQSSEELSPEMFMGLLRQDVHVMNTARLQGGSASWYISDAVQTLKDEVGEICGFTDKKPVTPPELPSQ
jgi:hypothetical protein